LGQFQILPKAVLEMEKLREGLEDQGKSREEEGIVRWMVNWET
jgi:hypothetical protein